MYLESFLVSSLDIEPMTKTLVMAHSVSHAVLSYLMSQAHAKSVSVNILSCDDEISTHQFFKTQDNTDMTTVIKHHPQGNGQEEDKSLSL